MPRIGLGINGGIGLGHGPRLAGGVSYDWYVDSVSGDDGNDGRSPAAAFATIAALESAGISAGKRIALARGSNWREQLDITADNVTVEAYGAGSDPLLDAADTLANAGFSKTVGQTYVYEIAKALGPASTDNYVQVWENDTALARAASVAACDATAGTCYPTAENGNITLYVHPIGNTVPTTDGKQYEVSVRDGGVIADGRSGTILRGLHTRRNRRGSGSIVVGRSCRLYDCTMEDGNKHNIFHADGCYLENCTCRNCNPGNMYILYDDSPPGLGTTYVNCTATSDVYASQVTGFYHHHGGGGTLGAVVFDGCHVVDLGIGFGSAVGAASVAATNCTASGCNIAHALNDPICTITGGTITVTDAGESEMAVQISANPTQVTLDGVTISGIGLGVQYTQNQALALTVQNCEFAIQRPLYLHGNNVTLIADHNVVGDSITFYDLYETGLSVTSDYNAFGASSQSPFMITFANKSWAQWQALGYDVNSTHP